MFRKHTKDFWCNGPSNQILKSSSPCETGTQHVCQITHSWNWPSPHLSMWLSPTSSSRGFSLPNWPIDNEPRGMWEYSWELPHQSHCSFERRHTLLSDGSFYFLSCIQKQRLSVYEWSRHAERVLRKWREDFLVSRHGLIPASSEFLRCGCIYALRFLRLWILTFKLLFWSKAKSKEP